MKNFIVTLKKFFAGGWMKKTAVTNPYVQGAEGRREWNDRYGTMHQSLRLWQLAFFSTLMGNAVLGGVLGCIAMSAQVQPFVVETHDGIPYAIAPMQSTSVHDQRLINFAINQFILNARTVVQDPAAQKALLDKVYAYAANQTLPFLHDYYQNHQPFEMAQQKTITISIISSLPISEHLWQVMWDETVHNRADGNTTQVTRWVANVTVQFGDVNPHFINANPFGLYITQVAWTPMVLQGEST
jgi:type IV secretion system protein TrbF